MMMTLQDMKYTNDGGIMSRNIFTNEKHWFKQQCNDQLRGRVKDVPIPIYRQKENNFL